MKTVDISGVERRRATVSSKSLIALILFLPLLARAAFAVDLNQPVTVDIAAGTPLGQALLELFLKADVKYSAPSVAGYRTPALHETLPLGQALARLLQGTGLSFEPKGDTLWVFKSSSGASADPADPEGTGPARGDSDAVTETHGRKSPGNPEDREMSEVRVRGVHIPDAALTKPDMSFDGSMLERTGYRTVGDFLNSLPQSFGGGLNLGVISAGGSQNTTSQSAASTANLRGLGSASTLTLVNGQRIAPAEGSGAVDVTLIPLSAVDRIEIITSGASAAYGSDAVAGVVNIILKSDYQGVEVSGTVGGATEGGDFLHEYSVVVGHSWQETNFFVTRDCAWQQPIDSSQRAYVPSDIAGTTLLPGLHRCSTLLGGSQELPHDAQLRVIGVYTQRSVSQTENFNTLTPGLAAATRANVDQYVLNTNTTAPLSRTWAGAIYTSVSADKIVSPELLTLNAVPYMREGDRFNDQLRSLEVGAAGTVLQIGWWNAKLALGAGGSVDDFLSASIPPGSFLITKQRRSHFGFVETALPILPAADADSRSPELALDVAVRKQHYSDVGTTTNPKVTLSYTPAANFALAASWGTSFRAPSLLQEYNISQATLKSIPDSSVAGGQSLGLFRFGGNPNLQPEEASESTLYLTFAPRSLPDLVLQLDYYDIFYSKRIEFPTSNTGNPLADPNVWPFVTRNPSAAQIAQIVSESQLVDLTGGQSTPAEAAVIVDDRNRNIARQRAAGVDFLGKYDRDTDVGLWDYSLNIAYLRLEQQVTSETPMVSLSGTVFYPPVWRGRMGVTWESGSYQGSIYANYTGPLSERDSLPPGTVASWLTFDAVVGYTLHTHGYCGTSRLTLSAQNILNRRPPYVATTQAGAAAVNYDSTNASPVGRLLVLKFTVFW